VEPYPDAELGLAAGQGRPEAVYEQREAVELAFIAAVQHLPGTQLAVLLLRDVLGFSAREAAESLDTTEASVNSALQRARRSVRERLPERSQQATLRTLGDDHVRDIVERYIDAWTRGDVDAIAAMLAEDATFAMPPYPAWWQGRHVIASFAAKPVHRYLPTRANGQAANATYRWDPNGFEVRCRGAGGAHPRGVGRQGDDGLHDAPAFLEIRSAGRPRSLTCARYSGRCSRASTCSAVEVRAASPTGRDLSTPACAWNGHLRSCWGATARL